MEDAQVLGAISAHERPVKGLIEPILPCTDLTAGSGLGFRVKGQGPALGFYTRPWA